MYSCHGFLMGGHVAQAAMCLTTGSTARVRFRVSEWWRFSSVLNTHTPPGVNSAYYRMSTEGKAAERRTSAVAVYT